MSNEGLTLCAIGLAVGTFGTLIGAGGGFILVPILLLLYPTFKPETITGISLTVVFFNALSGSIAYMRKGKIHYRSAFILSAAAAPGALIGAYLITFVPRAKFEFAFGLTMIVLAAYLLLGRIQPKPNKAKSNRNVQILTDKDGNRHEIAYDGRLAVAISAVVGFVSSLLGIGGGIIHVPALIRLLNFPVHIATATSHATLAIMSLAGVIEHVYRGHLNDVIGQVLWLAPSVVIGAQIGAYLSPKVHGQWIVRGLALGLLVAGLRFIL